MDKVGSEGDEARAMMREIRTLSLNPGVNLGGMGTLFSNSNSNSNFNSSSPKIFNDSNHPTQVSFSPKKESAPTSFDFNRNYNLNSRNDTDNRGDNLFQNSEEHSSNYENDEEDSLDYDINRVEGNLSMSISGSESGRTGTGTGLDDSGFMSP